MSVLMSGRRANSLGSTQAANANRPRDHELEVLAQVAVRPFESCDSVARPGDQQVQRAGVWDPTSSFLQAASRSFERSKSAHDVLSQTSASLPRLEDRSLHGIWAGTSSQERQYLRSEEGLGWG